MVYYTCSGDAADSILGHDVPNTFEFMTVIIIICLKSKITGFKIFNELSFAKNKKKHLYTLSSPI